MYNAVAGKSEKKLMPFPKIIVIVPDNDILWSLIAISEPGCSLSSKVITRLLNYVMTEHDRTVAAFKEYLPAKCIHSTHPQILWIQLPLHDNFVDNPERIKFNRCLERWQNYTIMCLH